MRGVRKIGRGVVVMACVVAILAGIAVVAVRAELVFLVGPAQARMITWGAYAGIGCGVVAPFRLRWGQ